MTTSVLESSVEKATMRILFIFIVCSLIMNTAYAQSLGPVLSWSVPESEVANVTRWQVCVDGACVDVTPSGSNGAFSYQFESPLSVQSHTFSVNACNPIACVASDALTVSLPPRPSGVALR